LLTRRENRKRLGQCVKCGVELREGSSSIRCSYHADLRRRSKRRGRKSLKAKILHEYGGQCACCGEDEPVFLSIDHIATDGAEHRRSLKNQGSYTVYRWLSANGFPKDNFQLLCHNCNMGRYLNGGECPHQKGFRLAVGF